MKKTQNIEKLFDFITKKLDTKYIDKFYLKAKINSEIIDLGKAIIISLIYKIDSTYLGPEYIDDEKKIKAHFKWCYTEILNEIKKIENIKLSDDSMLYDYLCEYFYYSYYCLEAETDPLLKNVEHHLEYFLNVLDLGYNKSEFDLENIDNFNKMFLQLINE